MANLISNLLAKVSPMGQMLQQATGIAQAAQTGNPMGMLQQNDPRMQEVYNIINQRGGNAEQVFYAMARERGFNPQEVLEQVKQMIK